MSKVIQNMIHYQAKRCLLRLIFLLVFSLMLMSGYSKNYYFSTINGNDDNAGTSSAAPKETVNAIKQILGLLEAGDTIFLERGSVWYRTSIFLSGKSGTKENPIVFDAYGNGENPVFSGLSVLSSPYQDENIYTFNDSYIPFVLFTSKSYGRRFPGYVTIGGKPYYPARYPNSGYLKSTGSNRLSVTDNSQSWPKDIWKDGWVGVKSVKWNWSDVRVLSNTSTVLSTTEHGNYNPYGPKYYFIFNAYNALDQDGEWAAKEGSLSVFWSKGDLPEVKVSYVDRIMTLLNCSYIHFSNIDFVGANVACVKITKGDYNKIEHCRIIGSGEFGVYIGGSPMGPGNHGDTENNQVSYCEIADCGAAAIYSRYCRGGIFTNNYIHRVSIFPGYQNIYEEGSTDGCYAIMVWNNIMLKPVVKQNFLDSVAGGISNHYNGDELDVRENFITNYGMGDLSDLGGFYVVSDNYSTTLKKRINRNFFLKAHEPSGAQENYNSDSYTHAVYFDQDSYGVKADSNSIEIADVALLTNGGKARSFNHNNILYPGVHKNSGAIVNSYLLPLMSGSKAESDTMIHNNVVFDSNGEPGYIFLRAASSYGCTLPLKGQIDYNRWFDPSGTSATIAQIYNGYNLEHSFTLPIWQSISFNCSDYLADPGKNSTYDKMFYTSATLFKNWSADAHNFKLDATYVDVEGKIVTGSIKVPAFYSKLLFQISAETKPQTNLYIDSSLIPEPFYAGPKQIVTFAKNVQPVEEIRYFPNPVHDVITITSLPPRGRISVFNIAGIKVYDLEIKGNSRVSIDMQSLNTGIYLVRIDDLNRTLKAFKIIKH